MSYSGKNDPEWTTVISAIPGPFAVQVGDRFQHVTHTAGEWLGVPAEVLTDRQWSTPFTPSESQRIEQGGLETARETGEWHGVVHPRTAPDTNESVPVTLRATGNKTVVWAFGDTASESGPTRSGTTASADAATDLSGERTDDARRLADDLRSDPHFLRDVMDALDDVLYVLDENADFVYWNEEVCDRFGYDHSEIAEMDPSAFVDPEPPNCLPVDPDSLFELDNHRSVKLITSDGESILHELHGVTYRDEATGDRYRVGIARDVSDRYERERELECQRHELETLEQLTSLVLETTRDVIESGNRERIEQTVCDRLACSPCYEFAWIGRQTGENSSITPWVTASDGLDSVPASELRATDSTRLAASALEDCTVEVETLTGSGARPWKDESDGDATVAAVPLHYADCVYGVLLVYASRSEVFGPRECRNLRMLGRTVGCLIDAAQNRRLLFANGVVELAFSLGPDESAPARVARDCGCELTFEGVVESDEQWVLYLEVTGISPAAVVSVAEAQEEVDRARVVSTAAENPSVEFILREESLPQTTHEAGGTVRDARFGPGRRRLVIDVPAGVNVRHVVDQFTATYPDAELVARRERDRSVTDAASPDDVRARLTDRQREVIATAYQAGYYGWPRESTAEEVAETLDLAPSTVHGHLRKAERALIGALFED